MNNWQVTLLTLFPEMFPGPLAHSLAGKALQKKLCSINLVNIRDFACDKYHTVDDKVFGGGSGMLMKPDVVSRALDFAIEKYSPEKLIYFTPRGKKFDQVIAQDLVKQNNILILCGRYEGVDQRIFKKYSFAEYSIGDFILSGGEMAALTALDACIRLLPGVIENPAANNEESFSIEGKLLEYDQYTRPAVWEGMKVPDVLVSGNHAEISKWRLNNAIENTKFRRPELCE